MQYTLLLLFFWGTIFVPVIVILAHEEQDSPERERACGGVVNEDESDYGIHVQETHTERKDGEGYQEESPEDDDASSDDSYEESSEGGDSDETHVGSTRKYSADNSGQRDEGNEASGGTSEYGEGQGSRENDETLNHEYENRTNGDGGEEGRKTGGEIHVGMSF
ncbi:acidic leucine-rich nuclear phosphoprotein 32 family member B-like [Anabrus simplex]|uniref:acidic leucine-rich nuclear phosphoprotein 32 family member B-like n=1 Tax=Anabrus simplex TaxID=316456 RepID=UPI0035A33F56